MTEKEALPSRAVLYARGVAWWIAFLACTIPFTIPVLLALLISYETGFKIIRIWLRFSLWALQKICKIDWDVQGMANLPDNPVLVMSKHQSTFETFYLAHALKQPVFVAKRELAYVPCFGWCFWMADSVLISRGAGRSAMRQIEEQSRERFDRGRCVVIFPEGTRRPPGAEPVYRIGGAVVATKLGVKVVPIAHNAGEYWPRLSLIKWPGTIKIRIGPAIDASGRKPDEVLAEVQDWIETEQEKITVLNRFPYEPGK